MHEKEPMTQRCAVSQSADDDAIADPDLLLRATAIYDAKRLVTELNAAGKSPWNAARIKTALAAGISLAPEEQAVLASLLPRPPMHHPNYRFRFIDLFAGIGGIRSGFEAIGGQCVFTSEWNKHAVRTYKANWYCDPQQHHFNDDIRNVTLSHQKQVSDVDAAAHIRSRVPQHDVLLAGFPCQPFSLAGVSKKNALGRAHGFACETQGTLFFDVARIIDACRPAIFVLENVKNLKSHDKGNTFRIIMETLDALGYEVADADATGRDDPKVIDGRHFLPQHRERIVLVGFRRDLGLHRGFTLRDLPGCYPAQRPTFAELLDGEVDEKYILSPKLWDYLYRYAQKHQAKGNGFGYGLVDPLDAASVTRTLSARYYKDGAEILVDRGWDKALGAQAFDDSHNQLLRPRRLTPRECARLMGFEAPGQRQFRIPVSDTQAYRQFGNSVVVPAFTAVARLLAERIYRAAEQVHSEASDGRRTRQSHAQ